MVTVLHWVAVLPASVAWGWVAWFLALHLNRWSMRFNYINPEFLLARGFVEFVSHFVYACVFILTGAPVAPAHRTIVAYVLGAFGLLFSGFLLSYALATLDYWTIWGLLGMDVGTGFIVYKVSVDDIELEYTAEEDGVRSATQGHRPRLELR